MSNTDTQLSLLEDFQKQLVTHGVVTKSMVASIERALDSNFITSSVRLESYTDTPTTINLEKTIEAVKNKTADVLYIKDTERYTVEDFLNDIREIKETLQTGGDSYNLASIVLNYVPRISPSVIAFLSDSNNLKYYNDKDEIENAFDIPLGKLLFSHNDFTEHLHKVANEGLDFDTAEQQKEAFLSTLNSLKTCESSPTENDVLKDGESPVMIQPFITFFANFSGDINPIAFFSIPSRTAYYENITLETILKLYNNNQGYLKELMMYFKDIIKWLDFIATSEPNTEEMKQVREIKELLDSHEHTLKYIKVFLEYIKQK